MKGSNIVSAIHHLRMAKEFFHDFCRQNKSSRGERLFKRYIDKIDYIFRDMLTCIVFSREMTDEIRKEINSDVFAIPAIGEKVALLNPDQRELVESVIDAMLAGEEIKIAEV